MPRVWNKRDPECPRDAVYVGRPTKWGNPFSHLPHASCDVAFVPTREEAIEKHAEWLMTGDGQHLLEHIHELRGKDLACWCAPDTCHAELLLILANG